MDTAIGADAQQMGGQHWKPIAFFSRKQNIAQKAYSTYDREILAIYLSVKQLREFLEEREFVTYTDHK